MGTPTQKRTKSSKRKRSIHYKLDGVKIFSCPKCKKKVLAHHACSFCGTYKGLEIIKMKTKTKKEKKAENKKEKKRKK